MMLLDVSTPKRPGMFARVDDDVFADVSRFKWYVTKSGYVARNRARDVKPRAEYLHRRIMGEPACVVDHINHDTLDNLRTNLRLATRQDNAANKRVSARCGLKGVTAHAGGWWRARIMVSGKQICLGLHRTPEAAHAAYAVAARAHFGEFALADRRGDKVNPTK